MITSDSTYNETIHHPQFFDKFLHLYMICLVSRPASIIFIMFATVCLCFHLPLSVFILHHGAKQWKKRSASSPASTSNSDCFSYHLAVMELIGVTGYLAIVCTICKVEAPGLLEAGILLSSYTWFGDMFFLLLMCVEHYLAVVHPIVYLNLRKDRWIRIRNVALGFVWLLCLFGIALIKVNLFIITNFCLLTLNVSVVSFCNFSVLRVLMRPGPGEQGGGRGRSDQSKQRAFYTILAILGVLVLRFAWGIVWAVMYMTGGSSDCVKMTIDVWFNFPSSLVASLLFVLRTGKCVCCKTIIK